jgi:hypothetical protein
MDRPVNRIAGVLQRQLLEARNADGAWGYERGRTSRLEPTCWALLALRGNRAGFDRLLAQWPSDDGALLEHREGLANWSFHALALTTRLALAEAPVAELQLLAHVLAKARGIVTGPSSVQRQNNGLQGWSWIDGTFSWGEPTAWALLALKKCRGRGVPVGGVDVRIRDGEALLRDRMCVTGGWNYGNSNVFAQNLPAYVPTTAIALLALQDHGEAPFVRGSLNFLEEHAGNHPSARALALSTLALKRHGRAIAHVEEALRTWLATHPPTDVVSIGMALCALEHDDAFAL